MKQKKYREKIDSIVKIIRKFSWYEDENEKLGLNNQVALNLLKKILALLKLIRPDKNRTKTINVSHYRRCLIAVRNALHRKEYGLACHELYDIAYF